MAELTNRLIDLCRSDEPKTALAALEMFLNRILGKPKETIEMDVNTNSPAALTLDADDLQALERMRRKLSSEPEVIVTPLPDGDE
ncbi:hypothetical protein FTUN_0761 [Frigoriglobus tundricola]|uniref:Uncharacterized protein n=2 Tax=Frigoriglobus tundricola TaxID=2774151 RepID=A0A6M5YJ02_9BACT|nr:hypothetical protein FTUN_0761 [Frigoriglobus tundricola]